MTSLTAIDTTSGYIFSTVVRVKGCGGPHAFMSTLQWLRMLGYEKVILQ